MGSPTENQREGSDDALPPSYDETPQQASSRAAAAAAAATDSKRPRNGPQDTADAGPIADSPPGFPPAYAEASTSGSAKPSTAGSAAQSHADLPEVFIPQPAPAPQHGPLLLAVPQTAPEPAAPFLAAYNAEVLLRRGIPDEAFASFLSGLSGILGAGASSRALWRAADLGRDLGEVPRRFTADTAAHARDVGRSVGRSARDGRLVSAGLGAVAGSVSVSVSAALRVVDVAVRRLPAAVGDGLARKTPTPRERADAYLADAAAGDRFAPRGLLPLLCDTAGMLRMLLPPANSWDGSVGADAAAAKELVDLVRGLRGEGPEAQLRALHARFGLPLLDVARGRQDDRDSRPLDIGTRTLWLVLTDVSNVG